MSFSPCGEKNYPVLERLTPLSDKQITNKLDVDSKCCTSHIEQGGNVYQTRGDIQNLFLGEKYAVLRN